MPPSLLKAIVHRYYEQMWNHWRLDLAAELLLADIRFRGSFGTEAHGITAFKRYMGTVRAAFPDFHNKIIDLVVEEDRAAVRLSYEGTHLGELFSIPPTRRKIRYAGAAFYKFRGRKIANGWVLGDVASLRRQLERTLPR